MYAVGRLSSYITRGVSTVSGPFHPFGGAIDIIVVQQQDGSLKSSPWYVRFGKFQGVLKVKERVVDIHVNGVEAGFHMYLNPRGEAYFLRETGGDSDSKSCDFGKCNSLLNAHNSQSFSRTLGFSLDRKAVNDANLSNVDASSSGRKSAEIAADLLEMKWSTSCSNQTKNENVEEHGKYDGEVTSGKLESSLVLHEEHFVHKPKDDETVTEVAKEGDKVTITNVDSDGVVEIYEGSLGNNISNKEPLKIVEGNKEPLKIVEGNKEPLKIVEGNNEPLKIVEGNKEPLKIVEGNKEPLKTVEANKEPLKTVEANKEPLKTVEGNKEPLKIVEGSHTEAVSEEIQDDIKLQLKSNGEVLTKEEPERSVEQHVTFSEPDDKNPRVEQGLTDPKCVSDPSQCASDQGVTKHETEGLKGNFRKYPSDSDLIKSYKLMEEHNAPHTKSLPNIVSHFDDLYPFYSGQRFSKWDIIRKDASQIIRGGFQHRKLKHGDIADIVDDAAKSWRLWPFGKSKSKRLSQREQMCKKDADVDSRVEVDGEKDNSSKQKKVHKEVTPTSEELQSLNLTEGKNTVTFKFSTAVLGNQQVDARIFLWRWDTHIVISDVDGTITKSDVLGQFMPMMGKDWSHIGVTNLFSAIKENGYQLLFLSARSISQADVTRQFLINLKQDGKTLPEGPVVISPDGLFPSLFREVIRRAPHEFKIACLEDIRVCFPADWNPFYAGFGNRDTDEFSYLKVGIQKGRIFIINPKGEVVVNRCNDTKTYNSLHTIVNETFPPKSEQGGG